MKWKSVTWLFARYQYVGVIFTIFGIGSVIWSLQCPGAVIQKTLAAFWSVGPPVWFFFEFHWARATLGEPAFNRLKESQESAAKIWAGLVAVLGILVITTP